MTNRDARSVVFPYRAMLAHDAIEDSASPIRIETESRFDDYGNEILRGEFGVVENNDRSAGDDERVNYRYNRIGNMISQSSKIDDRDERDRSVTNLGLRSHGGVAGDRNRNGRLVAEAAGPHDLTSTNNGTLTICNIPYDNTGNMT